MEAGGSLFGNANLETNDLLVLGGYFVSVLAFGLWSSRGNKGSVSGFFLAGRSMHWIPVGASMLLSNLGAEHIVGLSGGGASTGFAVANFELHAVFMLMLLAWVFVPVYTASGVFTMPEYLSKRYGGQRLQIFLSIYSLLAYILTKVSVGLFAGALFIEQALGWDLYTSILLILAISGLFTIVGGLTAVIWTDFIQSIIMIGGSATMMYIAFGRIGGMDALYEQFIQSRPAILNGNTTCGLPPPDSYRLIQDPVGGTAPWPGVFFGITTIAIWYWCTDQVIVQRALSAKSLTHAKAGCILAAYGKIVPFFIFVIPGMIARVLWPDTVGCVNPDECEKICDIRGGCSNIAYPTMVIELMPSGARGLMMAVMLSAVVSSLTSIFNSSSTLFTMDIYRRIRPRAHELELVMVGRLFVFVLVVLSILWVPVIKASKGSELFTYLQTIQGYMGPPICAIFLMAVLTTRINEQGAFWGMLTGFMAGVVRFIYEFIIYPGAACGEEAAYQPWWIAQVHFLYFSVFIFFASSLIAWVISMLTQPIPAASLHRLTFQTRFSTEKRADLDMNPFRADTAGDLEKELADEQNEGGFMHFLRMVCCSSAPADPTSVEEEITPEEKQIREKNMIDIHESPGWSAFCNLNGVIVCVVTVFIWGYFND